MLSRRYLRIKVLQILYAYKNSEEKSIAKHEKELFHSINKSHELFFQLLLIFPELKHLEELQIDVGLHKNFPTEKERKPSLNFVNNRIIRAISENPEVVTHLQSNGSMWNQHPEFLKKIYRNLTGQEYYEKYKEIRQPQLSDDNKFIQTIIDELRNNDDLYNILEEQCVYWNDEIDFTFSMISKSVKQFSEENDKLAIFPLFKDEDDREFVKTLFRKVCVNNKEYTDIIDKFTTNWELERIAFMDVLIMQMAIAEFLEFTNIPTKVTLNEFIEISKYYSTKRSSTFINGVLDKIFHHYIKENRVKKSGRGLVGDLKKN